MPSAFACFLAEAVRSESLLSHLKLYTTFDSMNQVYFTPSMYPCSLQETMESRFIRICGSGAAKDWQFWIEVPEDSALSVRLSAFHTRPNKAIERLVAGWPDWAFPIQLTSFASEYNLL